MVMSSDSDGCHDRIDELCCGLHYVAGSASGELFGGIGAGT